MPYRALRTAFAGLVVALIFAACEEGPGSSPEPQEPPRPVPAWSPPTWIHGTWSVSASTGSVKYTADPYNVVIDIVASGARVQFDLAQLSVDGVATITHEAGVSRAGEQYYAVIIRIPDSTNAFTCFKVDSTTMDLYWALTDQSGQREIEPVRLTKE